MTAPKRAAQRTKKKKPAESAGYLEASRRPLQILVFLLPLIVTYELGLLWLLRSEDGTLTITAHGALVRFFNSFGVLPAGLYLGGLAIVVVMLVWHLLTRESWKVDLSVVGMMAAEAALLALPLVAAGQVIARVIPAMSITAPPGVQAVGDLSPLHGIVISFGAGLYEELLFRMILIAVLHTLLVDVCGASHRVGASVAVVVAAVAFAAYHPFQDAAGGIAWSSLAFYFVAGLYFGTVYVIRGFGIVVGVHAAYDVLAIWLLPLLFAGPPE